MKSEQWCWFCRQKVCRKNNSGLLRFFTVFGRFVFRWVYVEFVVFNEFHNGNDNYGKNHVKRNLTNEVNELVTSNLSSGGNQLVGSIPSSFGQLRNLKLLWLGELQCQNQMDCFNIKTFTSEILFCVQCIV